MLSEVHGIESTLFDNSPAGYLSQILQSMEHSAVQRTIGIQLATSTNLVVDFPPAVVGDIELFRIRELVHINL